MDKQAKAECVKRLKSALAHLKTGTDYDEATAASDVCIAYHLMHRGGDTVAVRCCTSSCTETITVDVKHISANLLGAGWMLLSGAWHCPSCADDQVVTS